MRYPPSLSEHQRPPKRIQEWTLPEERITNRMNQGSTHLETMITKLNLLDHRAVDWKRVQRTAYLVHQHFRYEYPGPIDDLKQRLMIIPPDNHGDQRLVLHHLEVSTPTFEISRQHDAFG